MRLFTDTFRDQTLESIFSTSFNTSLIIYLLYLQGTQISDENSSLAKVLAVLTLCSLSSFLLMPSASTGLGTLDLKVHALLEQLIEEGFSDRWVDRAPNDSLDEKPIRSGPFTKLGVLGYSLLFMIGQSSLLSGEPQSYGLAGEGESSESCLCIAWTSPALVCLKAAGISSSDYSTIGGELKKKFLGLSSALYICSSLYGFDPLSLENVVSKNASRLSGSSLGNGSFAFILSQSSRPLTGSPSASISRLSFSGLSLNFKFPRSSIFNNRGLQLFTESVKQLSSSLLSSTLSGFFFFSYVFSLFYW